MEMLDRARRDYPRLAWRNDGIAEWAVGDESQYDLVFSNAALHWVDGHAELYPRLFARVSPCGALAVQVPVTKADVPARRILRELANSAKWRGLFSSTGIREAYVHRAEFYYDLLCRTAKGVDIWETTYVQVMPDIEAVGKWFRTTAMRPILDALPSEADQERFVAEYVEALRVELKTRPDGRILFPFARLFLIARK
jgi:trans-aconitate 2-methyltransferase